MFALDKESGAVPNPLGRGRVVLGWVIREAANVFQRAQKNLDRNAEAHSTCLFVALEIRQEELSHRELL